MIIFVVLILSCNAYAEPSSFHSKLVQLQQLSESHPDQAITQLEELRNQLPADAAETDRRDLNQMQLPLYIDKGNKKRATELVNELIQLGSQYHDPVANFWAINFKAKMLANEAKYGEGLAIIEPVLGPVKQFNDSLLRNQVENTAGELYSSIGNFQEALVHDLSALDSLTALKEDNWLSQLYRARTMNTIGRMYLSLKDDDTALSYLSKAEDLADHLDSPALLSSIANNKGYAYADQENWKSAILAYEESLAIARKVGNQAAEAKSLNNLADASLNQKDYPACVRYAQQSIKVAHQNELNNTEAIAQTNLGICHIYMGEIQKGVAEDKLGMDFARNANAKPTLEGMYSDLASAYKKVGMYKEAMQALEERDRITNELFHADRDRTMIEMQVHFDLSQRQKEIEKLEQQNKLQQSEIKNKNLQKIVSIFLVSTSVIALIGIFFLYKRVRTSNRRLRAANLKLKDQTTRDPLTGLLNRRAFQNMIESFNLETDRRIPSDAGLHDVLVLLDIDHFKNINDTYGHPTGDCVLIEIGRRLQKILREKDMLMRWGGEEFLIYLHRVPIDKVPEIVRRELVVVGSTPIAQKEKNKTDVSVTISGGYILMPLPGAGEAKLTWEKALKLVDLALYMAKTNGRNQAIGLDNVQGTKEQVDALIDGDLQGALDIGIIELQRVKGV